MKGEQLKITQPHTPLLMTRQRSRPTQLKSSAVLEAEEADKLHKYVPRPLALVSTHAKRPLTLPVLGASVLVSCSDWCTMGGKTKHSSSSSPRQV